MSTTEIVYFSRLSSEELKVAEDRLKAIDDNRKELAEGLLPDEECVMTDYAHKVYLLDKYLRNKLECNLPDGLFVNTIELYQSGNANGFLRKLWTNELVGFVRYRV